jgi:hypothetical protein
MTVAVVPPESTTFMFPVGAVPVSVCDGELHLVISAAHDMIDAPRPRTFGLLSLYYSVGAGRCSLTRTCTTPSTLDLRTMWTSSSLSISTYVSSSPHRTS